MFYKRKFDTIAEVLTCKEKNNKKCVYLYMYIRNEASSIPKLIKKMIVNHFIESMVERTLFLKSVFSPYGFSFKSMR